MKRQIDTKLIERSIRDILVALGDDPEREGLKETPKRVAKMFEEVFEGMTLSNDEIAEFLEQLLKMKRSMNVKITLSSLKIFQFLVIVSII